MKYMLSLLFVIIGYHTFSYGLYIVKKEKKKLAAFGVFLIAVSGTVIPIIMLVKFF